MSLPKRKHPRLKQYDYSEPGAYFITVCTKNKAHILSRIVVDLPSSVGRDALIPPRVQLLPAGKIVDDLIRRTETVYDNVTVDAYVIMPNHLHILFHIHAPGNGGGMGASPPYDSPNGLCHQNGDYTPPRPFHLSNILLRSCHTRAAGL